MNARDLDVKVSKPVEPIQRVAEDRWDSAVQNVIEAQRLFKEASNILNKKTVYADEEVYANSVSSVKQMRLLKVNYKLVEFHVTFVNLYFYLVARKTN